MKITKIFNIHFFLTLLIIVLSIALDSGSKKYLKNLAHEVYIGDFLNITSQCNSGVSFGLFQNNNYLIVAILIICIVLLIYTLQLSINSLKHANFTALICGGALANLIDRIENGCVYDFLDFHIKTYHWYTFNLADSLIFCGVVGILITECLNEKKL